jgi:hypothetical protein
MAASATASAKVSFNDFIFVSILSVSSIPKQVGVVCICALQGKKPKATQGICMNTSHPH